jgi:lipopolysaccharide heptosyltransferase II
VIYVLITYLFYPFLRLITSLNKKHAFRKILVIQTAKIGDMICSTPIFREIKKKYPDASLSVMASPATVELLKYNPYVDNVITLDTKGIKGISGKLKLIKLLRKGEYDVSLSLNPNIPFTIASLWSLIPLRIAIMPNYCGLTLKTAFGLNTHFVRHKTQRLVLETYMDMLKAIGIKTENISKEVYKSPGADEKVKVFLSKSQDIKNSLKIGIAVSSGNKLKELDKNTIAALANQLISDLNAGVVLMGSGADKNIAREILEMSENKNSIIDSTGVFSLDELPALIEQLSMLIGVDSGITYMADTLSVPLIDIAGPSDMSDQRPLGKNSIIIQKDISCVPCSHAFMAPYFCKSGDKQCVTSVSVAEIIKAAKKLLGTS